MSLPFPHKDLIDSVGVPGEASPPPPKASSPKSRKKNDEEARRLEEMRLAEEKRLAEEQTRYFFVFIDITCCVSTVLFVFFTCLNMNFPCYVTHMFKHMNASTCRNFPT